MQNARISSKDCHLLALPAELHLKILYEIERQSGDRQTLRSLSQTCRCLFDQFKEGFYHTVTLRADARSGRSLQSISTGPRASLVKKLIFRAHDPRPAWERHQDPRYRLSIPSKQVLIFLNRFSNLQEFELDVEWKLDLWFSEHPEPALYPVKGHSETYRFILDETLRALGRSVHHNQARALPKLSIRRLPSRVYQALIDHGLHVLLNDLKSFHIEFMDEMRQPVPPSHCKFVSQMKHYCLGHLHNVRALYLQASPGSMVGESDGLAAVDFNGVNMPFLRRLKLEQFLLGKDTEAFILRHLRTLNTINFENCYKDRSWSILFIKMLRRKPSKLTRFEVSEPPPSILATEKLESEPAFLAQNAANSTIDNRKTFLRAESYCGQIQRNHADEIAELNSGDTLEAWQRLQEIVLANRQCWERFSQSRLAQ